MRTLQQHTSCAWLGLRGGTGLGETPSRPSRHQQLLDQQLAEGSRGPRAPRCDTRAPQDLAAEGHSSAVPSPACTRPAASPVGQEQAPGRRAGMDRPGTGSFLSGHNFFLRPKLVPSGTGKTARPNPPCRLQGLGRDQNLGPLLLFLHLPWEARPLQERVSPHNPPPRSARELTLPQQLRNPLGTPLGWQSTPALLFQST